MPMHSAYISGNDIKTGTVISVAAKLVAPGDILALKYPNNGQVSGKVTLASLSDIEVEINSEIWRLRPHAPSDGAIHYSPSEIDASFWTVQTKV